VKQFSLDDVSWKLVQIIKTKDLEKVKYWINILERQKDPMVTATVFALINRHLARVDAELHRWFHEVYFEEFEPEVKQMWLEFTDLCSWSL
jgi:hypothetical protein